MSIRLPLLKGLVSDRVLICRGFNGLERVDLNHGIRCWDQESKWTADLNHILVQLQKLHPFSLTVVWDSDRTEWWGKAFLTCSLTGIAGGRIELALTDPQLDFNRPPHLLYHTFDFIHSREDERPSFPDGRL